MDINGTNVLGNPSAAIPTNGLTCGTLSACWERQPGAGMFVRSTLPLQATHITNSSHPLWDLAPDLTASMQVTVVGTIVEVASRILSPRSISCHCPCRNITGFCIWEIA